LNVADSYTPKDIHELKLGAATLSMTPFSITTLSIMTFSINKSATLSIMALLLIDVMPSVTNMTIMLRVIMLSVVNKTIMLSVTYAECRK
jgi:hypothetical protein